MIGLTQAQFQENYKICNFLGEGLAGDTWKVTNTKDGKDYALKMTKLPVGSNQKNEVMKRTEYLRNSGHDNITQCFHFTVVTKKSEGMY